MIPARSLPDVLRRFDFPFSSPPLMNTSTLPFILLLAGAFLLAGCDSGSVPDDVGANTAVTFTSASETVSEDAGTVTFEVDVRDVGFKTFSVDLVRSDASTVESSDIEAPSTTTLEFAESTTSGDSRTFEIAINDDNLHLEGTETVVYELANPTNAAIGENSTFTVTIEDNEADIGAAQTIADARGQALGTDVTVRGVVTRKEGSNIFIQDESGPDDVSGIVVRDDNLADAYDNGTIQPGDLLQAEGELDAFSGLLQVSGDVSFYEIERGTQALPAAQTVTVAELLGGGGEAYESELIAIEGLTIDAGGETVFPTSSTNFDNTSDASTDAAITLRVTDDSFYAGQPIPTEPVTYTGILGQFNFGFGGAREPDEGYQLLPQLDGDLE